MRTKTVVITVVLLLAAVGVYMHAGSGAECRRPELAAGYRGLVLELPPAQLAWVRKGDYLDVISVFDAIMKGDKKERIAATLLQHVKVAGVNPRRGTVVLLVNPNEAQYAALAKEQGPLSIALRAAGDKQLAAIEIASYRKLIR